MGVLHEAIPCQKKHQPKPRCQQHKPTLATLFTGSNSKTLSPNSLKSTDGRPWAAGSRSAAFSLIPRSTPASSFSVKHPGPEKKWKTGISLSYLSQRETKHSLNLPTIKRHSTSTFTFNVSNGGSTRIPLPPFQITSMVEATSVAFPSLESHRQSTDHAFDSVLQGFQWIGYEFRNDKQFTVRSL